MGRLCLVRACALVMSIAVMAGCGGDSDDGTDEARPPATEAPVVTVPGAGSRPTSAKAAPRWETIVTLTGAGPQQPEPFDVLPDAIQWRGRWSCTSGHLRVTTDPPPRRAGPFIDAECPQAGEAFSISSGPNRVVIDASGPWKLVIDQQLDTPLAEPPLPGLASGRVFGEGDFYRVEKEGKGIARLYQLEDGTRALRFEAFEVSTNTDLFVWLTDVNAPATTTQIVAGNRWVLGNLKSTVGDQNYLIPADVPVDQIKSVVIWCDPVAVAYSAAGFTR